MKIINWLKDNWEYPVGALIGFVIGFVVFGR